jgi:predicted DNA-binding protein
MELTKLSVNVPMSLNERWTAAAKRERRTKTALLQMALERYLDESEQAAKEEDK